MRSALPLVLGTYVTFLCAPAWAEDPAVDSVAVATEDGNAGVSIGLDAQVRYERIDPSNGETVSRFRLRRFRPILTFEGLGQFEVKVVPELSGEPELKDGVVRWIPNDWIKIEAGQFAPPFNWERDGSSDYHQFLERSVANNEFQIADGRDIGVQFDFEWGQLLDLEAGIFNGAGSNTFPEAGRGHIAAWRVAVAPFGFYHEVEVVPKVMDEPVLMIGAGGYAALDNAWRDWSPQPVPDAPQAADLWSVTADLHVWVWRMSLHASLFHRRIRLDDGPDDTTVFAGDGFTGQAGFLLIAERLMLAYRFSQANPFGTAAPAEIEHAVSLQLFHKGNESKFTLEASTVERPDGVDETFGRLQYQLLL